MFTCQKCHHPNKDEQNHAEAQYQLGRCYYYGRGGKKDQNSGRMWNHESALRGFEDAVDFEERLA